MPWCPVCRNEYKEGYEVCADCGAPLVASLEEFDKEKAREAVPVVEDCFEAEMSELSEPRNKEENEYKPYVKAKDRAENYKSSAYALTLVGSAGLFFLLLVFFGVIDFAFSGSTKVIILGVMLVIFLAFIYIGVRSFAVSKTIGALADDEDSLTEKIENYFKDNYTASAIDELALSQEDEDLTDEVKYFKRTAVIRKILKEEFGTLETSYEDNEVEVIFGNLYD